MEQFIYRIQPVRKEMLPEGPTDAEARIVSDHFSYLTDLADRGIVVMAGRTLNTDVSSFGIVVLEADSEEAARAIMEHDPAVANGVMRPELFPFRVALMAGSQGDG